jgi:ABC-type uncharacterized transport system ATPase subunit
MRKPLLRLQGLTKAYPGVLANDDISFEIGQGQMHALLGENGAGKSTLVKMIYGLVRPDKGQMVLRDQPYTPSQPSEARRAGVAMVFQHFSLFDAMDVAENVALGMENPPPCAIWHNAFAMFLKNMACRWIPRGWWAICRQANASAWKLCAACCKIRNC